MVDNIIKLLSDMDDMQGKELSAEELHLLIELLNKASALVKSSLAR